MTILKTELRLSCGQIIKNRFCKAAMTERIAEGNSFCNQKHINLYKTWASGDIGLLLTGNVQIDRNHMEGPANICIEESSYKKQISVLKKWAEVGTTNDTQLWMQISHAGRQTPGEMNSSPLAPSSVQLKIPGKKFGVPVAMTVKDIGEVIKRFIFVAKVARESGFTGIQIHSAHGYLLSEFLSPDINKRTDEWGGSLENRTRIHVEIIKGIRKALGNDFPISLKLNSADFQKGGFSPADALESARIMESAGIDLLEISGGTYEQPRLLGLDNLSINPERSENRKSSSIAREAYFLDYAENIKKSISIPIMVTGGFRTKDAMESSIKSNACQMIGVGRPLCADPQSIRKLLAGQIKELSTYEKSLSLGPWIFSPSSPFRLIQAINGFGTQAWCYQQIKRMARNEKPDLNMSMFSALKNDIRDDLASFKALKS